MHVFRLKHWATQLTPSKDRSVPGKNLAGKHGWWRHWLQPDAIAGLTAAAVVIPKAMAYADLAGLPTQIGLYTVLLPMLVYVLIGGSRILSVSTTTTLGILTAGALAEVVPGAGPALLMQTAALLAMLVGVLLLAATVLRLGMLADFISDPVLTGFKTGIGIAIIVDQVPKLIGLHIDKTWFGHDLVAILTHLDAANPATALLGLCLLAGLFLLRRIVPALPAPIFIIALSIMLASVLDYDGRGIAVIGSLPAGLPQPHLPVLDVDWRRQLLTLLAPAAGIALMSFTETIAAGRAFIAPGETRPSANRELLATGLGNLVGGLFGAMPSGGGTTQTAVNQLAGARSQVAAAITALCAALVLLYLAPVIGHLPEAAMAAVVIVYSISLISPGELRAILRIRKREFIWAIIALLGVLSLGTMQGIAVAVIASLLSLIYQANNPPVYELARKPGTDVFRAIRMRRIGPNTTKSTENAPQDPQRSADETFPGLVMLRVEGRFYFGNSRVIFDHLAALVRDRHLRVIALDLSAVVDIEYTALKSLIETDNQLQSRGVTLWLVGLNPSVMTILAHSELGHRMDDGGRLAEGHLGKGRLFHNMQEVVAAYLALPKPMASPGVSDI